MNYINECITWNQRNDFEYPYPHCSSSWEEERDGVVWEKSSNIFDLNFSNAIIITWFFMHLIF